MIMNEAEMFQINLVIVIFVNNINNKRIVEFRKNKVCKE